LFVVNFSFLCGVSFFWVWWVVVVILLGGGEEGGGGGGGGGGGRGGTALFLCGFRSLGCYNLFLLKGFPDSSSSFCIFSSFRFSARRL